MKIKEPGVVTLVYMVIETQRARAVCVYVMCEIYKILNGMIPGNIPRTSHCDRSNISVEVSNIACST